MEGGARGLGSTSYINSVDADDGLNGDFRGGNGNCWYSYHPFDLASGGSSHEFLFSPNALGQYPTYVGFVVTSVGDINDVVEFGAITKEGFSVGDEHYLDDAITRPYESTTNHRFMGLYWESGITKLTIKNADEIDHLQYGYSIAGVPEPSTYLLMGLGLAVIGCVMRRRRK